MDLNVMGFGTQKRISDFCLFVSCCIIVSGKSWAKVVVLSWDSVE